ncbi:MAG: TRAP transporter small permease [Acidaminococcaceae bacterium]|jgi:TRAP-type C4-dicarboxylate transport system permease small subunit|nr:TRAP transporter small permease [Acidaminococcaceae bacterium]MCI2110315.1 TRAP transporter small permease [Acidaminococcaceae bacterium]
MEKFKHIIDKILIICCELMCGVMVILVTWQVFARYVLIKPSNITEELSKIIFVWMTLFGAALLYGERGHMNINVIPEKLPPIPKKIMSIVVEIINTFFAAWILTKGGIIIATRAMSQTNEAMPFISSGQIYMAVPICGICTVFYGLCNIWADVKFLKNYNNDSSKKAVN